MNQRADSWKKNLVSIVAKPPNSRLVWPFRGPLRLCGGFVMRTSERKPHQINRFASVLSIPKFETWPCKCDELRNRDTEVAFESYPDASNWV